MRRRTPPRSDPGRRRAYRAATAIWACALAVVATLASPAFAQRLVADLSSREIAISTGFTGAELLLFGATEGSGDIVVTVEGPARSEVVRRKQRVAGIWVNGDSITFDNTPAYYWIASSRTLADIAPAKLLSTLEIGYERQPMPPRGDHAADALAEFREALFRNKRAHGLYGSGESEIRIIGGKLFRTTIPFPANVLTGHYVATVFLFKNGRLVSRERTPLAVHRTGLEAQIYNFAHDEAPWYGAIAIVIALLAGWLAGVIFRRG